MVLIATEALWQTQVVANTIPADPFAVSVPGSSWVSDQLSPFGDGDFFGLPVTEPNTVWARTNGFWMRRFVVLNGQAPILIKGSCRQAFYLFFDGDYVGTLNPSNTPRDDVAEYRVVIPIQLATAATHEIALLCLDNAAGEGDVCYISFEADYLPPMIALQPEAPASETLTWLTDVATSKDGSEARVKIQTSPRQAFEYIYPTTAIKKSLIFNTIWGSLADEWLVPVWPQAQRVGGVAAGLTTLASISAECELRSGGMAILWQSDEQWQLVGVDTLGADFVELTTVTRAFSNAWLMPVRRGVITDNVTRRFNGHEASFSLTFRILDNNFLSVAVPDQYLGDDVYTEAGLLNGSTLSDDMMSNLDVFDPGQGTIEFYQNWDRSKIAHTQRVLCDGLSEAWAIREFLHRRAGRYRPFWQPSFENDLRIKSTGTIVSTVLIAKDAYLRYASDRTHLAFEVDGEWLFRIVSSVSIIDDDTLQLTLSSALNVAASAVLRVCWLSLKRLNTDRIEIRYPGAGVAETEFRLLEISP